MLINMLAPTQYLYILYGTIIHSHKLDQSWAVVYNLYRNSCPSFSMIYSFTSHKNSSKKEC